MLNLWYLVRFKLGSKAKNQTSQCAGPGSILRQSTRDVWWRDWPCNGYFGLPSRYNSTNASYLIQHSSTIDALQNSLSSCNVVKWTSLSLFLSLVSLCFPWGPLSCRNARIILSHRRPGWVLYIPWFDAASPGPRYLLARRKLPNSYTDKWQKNKQMLHE